MTFVRIKLVLHKGHFLYIKVFGFPKGLPRNSLLSFLEPQGNMVAKLEFDVTIIFIHYDSFPTAHKAYYRNQIWNKTILSFLQKQQ